MRCCTQTLAEEMEKRTEEPQEGEILACKYEGDDPSTMIYEAGCWRWNQAERS